MNREIKFRGKCVPDSKYAGKWVKGSLLVCDDGSALIVCALNDHNTMTYHVKPETVGQFVIKLPKDLNKFGKDGNYADFYDLYEDDIVQARESFVYYNSVYPFQCAKGDKFVLSHYDAGFCLVPIKTYENWAKDGRSPIIGGIIDNYELWNLHSKFVQIGNIHDNKELMRKEEI